MNIKFDELHPLLQHFVVSANRDRIDEALKANNRNEWTIIFNGVDLSIDINAYFERLDTWLNEQAEEMAKAIVAEKYQYLIDVLEEKKKSWEQDADW